MMYFLGSGLLILILVRLGYLIGRNAERKRLSLMDSDYGSIYKVIAEYREFLHFLIERHPSIPNDIEDAFWIKRIIVEHDQFLHRLLPLSDIPLNMSCVGRILNFPFEDLPWEGLDEFVRYGDEQKLAEIIKRAKASSQGSQG